MNRLKCGRKKDPSFMNCAGEIRLIGQLSEYDLRERDELFESLLSYAEQKFGKQLPDYDATREGLDPKPEEQRRMAMSYLHWLLERVDLLDSYRSIYCKNYASTPEGQAFLERRSYEDLRAIGEFLNHCNAAKLAMFAAQNQRTQPV